MNIGPEAIKKAADELISQYNIAVENLTKEQLADLLLQLVKSGDIVRYIQVNTGSIDKGIHHKQSLQYIPFRKVEELEQKVQSLKIACQAVLDWNKHYHENTEHYNEQEFKKLVLLLEDAIKQ